MRKSQITNRYAALENSDDNGGGGAGDGDVDINTARKILEYKRFCHAEST
jgi:hypothetical protein